MKKVRSHSFLGSHSCTELSKAQFFPVSIVNQQAKINIKQLSRYSTLRNYWACLAKPGYTNRKAGSIYNHLIGLCDQTKPSWLVYESKNYWLKKLLPDIQFHRMMMVRKILRTFSSRDKGFSKIQSSIFVVCITQFGTICLITKCKNNWEGLLTLGKI